MSDDCSRAREAVREGAYRAYKEKMLKIHEEYNAATRTAKQTREEEKEAAEENYGTRTEQARNARDAALSKAIDDYMRAVEDVTSP